ncbi:MAG: hypothetical protein IK055_01425 [Lachnospiraceae bacterium]|nr:hypothetical protein [Lachnospiraceae bacterium]
MATIESINEQYVSLLKDIDQVHFYEGSIASIQRSSANVIDKVKESIKNLTELIKNTNSACKL